MEIGEFIKESYMDYPGKISAVVFSPYCNYKCPACYAKTLLESESRRSEEEFFDYLDSAKGWIKGVVLCGGEPTLDLGLTDFARKLKDRGLAVKLDTNGSNPEVLSKLKKEGVIDYVAMDVKAPNFLYARAVGKNHIYLKNIEKGMQMTSQFPDYEFRTTIAPINRGKQVISFMSAEEIEDIAKWIVKTTKNNAHKYYLQPFVPKQGELISPQIEKFPETSGDLMEKAHREAIKHLPQSKIRYENL